MPFPSICCQKGSRVCTYPESDCKQINKFDFKKITVKCVLEYYIT